MWHEMVSEITALGWRAFVYGPEIHLALPVLYLILAAIILFWRLRK